MLQQLRGKAVPPARRKPASIFNAAAIPTRSRAAGDYTETSCYAVQTARPGSRGRCRRRADSEPRQTSGVVAGAVRFVPDRKACAGLLGRLARPTRGTYCPWCRLVVTAGPSMCRPYRTDLDPSPGVWWVNAHLRRSGLCSRIGDCKDAKTGC